MKRLIIFLLLFAAIKVAGQTTGYLRFDTVKIMKQNGTCELYIINKTKDSLGVLTNIGGGLTTFLKSRAINDSTIVVGLDTLVIRGATGGSASTVKVVHFLSELKAETGVSDTLVCLANFGIFRHRDSYPTNGQYVVPADNGTYWENVTKQFIPLVDQKINVMAGSRIIMIGNSISQEPTASYTTYVTFFQRALGSQIDNYSIAGSTVQNIGAMWRNDYLPSTRVGLAGLNNGINDIRFTQNEFVLNTIINCARSFLVAAFKNLTIDASAGTVTSGTWNAWTGLTVTEVSKTNGFATTDNGATLSFTLNTNGFIPGAFVSFMTNHNTTGATWTDSVDITDNLGNLLATVDLNKKSHLQYGPVVVFIPTLSVVATGIRVINRSSDSLVVDFVGMTHLRPMRQPAFVAEITKVKDAALQPGIGHDWWDEVNDSLRRMVADEFTAYGYPATSVPVNDEFFNNSSAYMFDDIHPSSYGHQQAIFKNLMKKVNIVTPPREEVITATDANYLIPTTQGYLDGSYTRTFILPPITANRTFQIAVGTRYMPYGQRIRIINRNGNASFSWSTVNWAMINNHGVGVTAIRNASVYDVVHEPNGMRIENIYAVDSAYRDSDTLRFLINGQPFAVNAPVSGGGGGTPGGSDTQIQYNDGGAFGGDAGLTFNETTNTVATDTVQAQALRGNRLIPFSGNVFAVQSLSGNVIQLSLKNTTGTDLLRHETFASGNSQIFANAILTISTPTTGSLNITHNANITDTRTAMTANAHALHATGSGTYNTTSGALMNFALRGTASGTRASGGNTLTNIGVLGTAVNAQVNYGGWFESQGSSTNSVQDGIVVNHVSSSTTAAGFGSGLLYKSEVSDGSIGDIAHIRAVMTTATAGAMNADLTFGTSATGSIAEKFRITSAGLGRFSGGLQIGSLSNGAAGTDSIAVVNNTDVKKIAGNHYTSQAAFIDSLSDHWAYMTSISGGSGSVTSVGLATGTSGTDIGVSGSPITSSGNITLNIPTASASNRGALSSSDWSTFNSKISNITSLISAGTNVSLTGTGTSGDPYVINSNNGTLVIVNDADHTVTSTQSAIRYQNNITANRTVTLPDPSSVTGREIWVKWNTIDGAFSINITTVSGTALIYLDGTSGSTSQPSNVDFLSVLLKSDGTSWYKIN